jgi:predicted acyltransferase
MVTANLLAPVHWIPTWLKHAPDPGITIVDFIAPAFLFAIGLTYGRSYRRRIDRDGRQRTVGHFLRRWFALIGIGAVISAGEVLTGATGRTPSWDVLQAIGLSGLLTLALIGRPTWTRLLAGVALIAVYQAGFGLFFENQVLQSTHGGLWAGLAWTAVLLLSTVIGDIAHQIPDLPRARSTPLRITALLLGSGFLLISAGLLLGNHIPISKPRVSASYVLVSLGVSAGFYWLWVMLNDTAGVCIRPLEWWGGNPLVLYVLHYMLLGILVLPRSDGWYVNAAPALMIAQLSLMLLLLTAVAFLLDRRKIRLIL